MSAVALVDNGAQLLLVAQEIYFKTIRICLSVYKPQILRDSLVEDKASYR